MKHLLSAILIAAVLSGCGMFKEPDDVGPYGDKRTKWQKLMTYEEERYDGWAEKVMHRDEHKRRKNSSVDKKNP